MSLDFNWFLLMPFVLMVLAALAAAYEKPRLLLALIVLVIFSAIFMPVKMTQQNMKVHEDTSKFDELPPKVDVKEMYYDEYMNEQYNNLKQDSKNEQP